LTTTQTPLPWAEAIWGAGIGFRNVFYATLGTGIGSGIVFDRRIYHGRTGSAAEGGHVSIDYNGPRCGCGKRGCIEALCSGPAIAQRARERLTKSKTPSRLRELAGGTLENLTAEHVAEAFREGDALAREVLEATADLLTVWVGNIIDFLEPDVIVFGGGIARLRANSSPHANRVAKVGNQCALLRNPNAASEIRFRRRNSRRRRSLPGGSHRATQHGAQNRA